MAQDGIDYVNERGEIALFRVESDKGKKDPPPRLLYVPDLLKEYVTWNGFYYLVDHEGYVWFSLVSPNGPYGQGPELDTPAAQALYDYEPSPEVFDIVRKVFEDIRVAEKAG